MTPLQPAIVPESEIFKPLPQLLDQWRQGEPSIIHAIGNVQDEKVATGKLRAFLREMIVSEKVYLNDKYQVSVREVGMPVSELQAPTLIHLSIKRIDRQPVHDWRDLQEIKNQLCGSECDGVELYPAESRRVDSANQYHIWVLKDPAMRWPVGFTTRYVTETPGGKAQQRPFEKVTA